MTNPKVNLDAVKSEIRAAVINQKANICPMSVRLAWHASGTYDKNDGTGGSNGGMRRSFVSIFVYNLATMRFEPEKSDAANAV
jgi:catalase (peroxidase I)